MRRQPSIELFRRHFESVKGAWIPSAIPFFILGWVYYLVSPALVFRFFSEENELLNVAAKFFYIGFFDWRYFLDSALILVSFLLGYFLAKALTRGRASIADHGSRQANVPGILAVSFGGLILFFAASAIAAGAGVFTGYSTYNILVLGPLSTCAFLAAWFFNYFARKPIRFLFLSFFAICSLLLLGWGSRMFFVLGLVALMLGLASRNRKLLRSLPFYGLIAVFFVLVIGVGIARQGGRDFGIDNLVAVLFAEPFFTSVSGSLYLERSGGRPTLGVPHDLLASVIHFVPSAIFPGKIELIREMTFDENVESPFGANALLVNLYSNFGIFYPAFIASVGCYYGFLCKKARHSIFYRATYFSALPVLTFLFYREGLSTVIKVLLFNGLAVPLFIALSLVWIFSRRSASRSKRPSPVPLSPSHTAP